MQPPALPVIFYDLSCVGCGYNLRTMAVTGICPECGRGVRESIFVGTPWHQAALGRKISLGAWLVFSASFVFMLGILLHRGGRNAIGAIGGADPMGARLWGVIASRILYWSRLYDRAMTVVALLLVLGSYGLRIAGIFLLTARPRAMSGLSLMDSTGLRWTTRIMAMLGPAFLIVLTVIWIASDSNLTDWRRPPQILLVLGIELALPCLAWGYLAMVARRMQLRRVRVLCLIAPWAATLSVPLYAAAFVGVSSALGMTGVVLHGAGALFSLITLAILAVAVRGVWRRMQGPIPAPAAVI